MSASVVVAGGGIIGTVFALALHHRSRGTVSVAIAEPRATRPPSNGRAYAITAASRALLTEIGVWPRLAASAQPVREMRITDSRLQDPVRQALLTFEASEAPLAHIVDEGDLLFTLSGELQAARIPAIAAGVTALHADAAGLELQLSDGRRARAALLAAADGAGSPCREMAGIAKVDWSYGQTGLVAAVAHARSHQGVAVQHFLPGGPFAILPMTGDRSSIVWIEPDEEAKTLLSLHPDDLHRELERRFGAWLGRIRLEAIPASFPIRYQMARRFVGERVALLGDAAHVIHPLAGQGLNLGLDDVDALSRRIIDMARVGLDPGDATALADYERDRRSACVGMGVTTDLLNRLFSNDALPARLVRDFGLGLVDRSRGFKEFFAHRAAGRQHAA